jgi:hypothetical protein
VGVLKLSTWRGRIWEPAGENIFGGREFFLNCHPDGRFLDRDTCRAPQMLALTAIKKRGLLDAKLPISCPSLRFSFLAFSSQLDVAEECAPRDSNPEPID